MSPMIRLPPVITCTSSMKPSEPGLLWTATASTVLTPVLVGPTLGAAKPAASTRTAGTHSRRVNQETAASFCMGTSAHSLDDQAHTIRARLVVLPHLIHGPLV